MEVEFDTIVGRLFQEGFPDFGIEGRRVIDEVCPGDADFFSEEGVTRPAHLDLSAILGLRLTRVQRQLLASLFLGYAREVALLVAEGVDRRPEPWPKSGLIHGELIGID